MSRLTWMRVNYSDPYGDLLYVITVIIVMLPYIWEQSSLITSMRAAGETTNMLLSWSRHPAPGPQSKCSGNSRISYTVVPVKFDT